MIMADLGQMTSNGIYLVPSPGSRNRPTLTLKAGDRLMADIIAKLEDGLYQIQLRGKTLQARSNLVFKPGDRVQVEVGQVSPGIILTPVTEDRSRTSARAALVRAALLANDKMGRLYNALRESLFGLSEGAASAAGTGDIARIRELLKGVVLEEGSKAEKIRDALNHGGLFFESKVKALLLSGRRVQGGLQGILRDDLKGNIMGLALRLQELTEHLSPGTVKDDLARLGEAIADYTRSVEAKEVINHLLSLNGRPFHFEIPLMIGEHIETLELYYEQLQHQSGKGERRGSRGYRVVLILDFPRGGRVTADLVLWSRSIDCRFMTEAKPLADLISANLPRLSAGLQAAGLTVSSLRADWGTKEAASRVETEEERFIDALRLIDLQA